MPAVKPFGTLADGREAHLYTLEVPGGWQATITDFGAILTSLHVPGKDGKPLDVVLGFDSLDRRYLKTIAEGFGGGPVGVETIAAALAASPILVASKSPPT